MADRKQTSSWRSAWCNQCQQKWNSIVRVDGKPVDVVAEAERHADTHQHLVHLTEDFTYDVWPAQKTPAPRSARSR
jgi:hypothetical protein